MSSPRKQRKLDDGTGETPKKVGNNLSSSNIVFTPMESFNWAEVSAQELELRIENNSPKEDKIEDDEEFPALTASQDSGGPANHTRSRKNATPKRADTKNKFEKNLDLTSALKFARSERIKKLEAEKRRVEKGQVEEGQRKRRRSPSTSTLASITPNRRSQPKKLQRFDDNASQSSHSSRNSRKSMTPNDTMSPRPLDDYKPPKLGWCEDVVVLQRRTIEIERAKAKSVYQRYRAEVPNTARVQSDPKTPNKYLKHSRRGWDAQVRKWKKSLYIWAGEEYTPSETSSRAASRSTSRASEVSDDDKCLDFENDKDGGKSDKLNGQKSQFSLENPDNMASLLGHFDLNTRQATLINEESTLKANENRTANAPIDFSQLHS